MTAPASFCLRSELSRQHVGASPGRPPYLQRPPNTDSMSGMHLAVQPGSAAPASTIEPATMHASLPISLTSHFMPDNAYTAEPPSTVAIDLEVDEYLPWRSCNTGDIVCGTSMQDMSPFYNQSPNPGAANFSDQSSVTWGPYARLSPFPTITRRSSHQSMTEGRLTPTVHAHSIGAVERGRSSLATQVRAMSSQRSPSLLSERVDASQFENVQPGLWPLSTVEWEMAPSPSSVGSHFSGPSTPRSAMYLDSAVGLNGERRSDAAGIQSASYKTETPFGSFPSIASLSGTMNCSATPTPHTIQFGDMTLMGAAATRVGAWPVVPAPTQAMYHPHAHGLPTGIPNLTQTYVDYPCAAPAAVQLPLIQGYHHDEEPEGHSMYASSEPCSDSESEVDGIEKTAGSLNEKALREARARRDRDETLLRMRDQGFSYKEIKRLAGFREAESTLRGRVRVLTKDKADRVRRPEWTAGDILLLRRAVHYYSAGEGRLHRAGGGRVPWKQVSEYLHEHGGSYHFAPLTCARKWKEL